MRVFAIPLPGPERHSSPWYDANTFTGGTWGGPFSGMMDLNRIAKWPYYISDRQQRLITGNKSNGTLTRGCL
jgi:hypothetical protein